jgi:hypothetical protein
MELEKILNDFLEEKEIKKEEINEKLLVINGLQDDKYEKEEEEEEEEDEDEDYQDIDIETISDIERMKIASDILHHIQNYYPGLEKIIMTLEDIIEDSSDY